jgi:hypothetical protein
MLPRRARRCLATSLPGSSKPRESVRQYRFSVIGGDGDSGDGAATELQSPQA